jgi:hypothetical protein
MYIKSSCPFQSYVIEEAITFQSEGPHIPRREVHVTMTRLFSNFLPP